MSKIEFLGALEAEKLTKEKWKQYCEHPVYWGYSPSSVQYMPKNNTVSISYPIINFTSMGTRCQEQNRNIGMSVNNIALMAMTCLKHLTTA